VRPGLTGLAQVKGRNSISWDEKLRWDVKYVDEVSFIEDFNLVIETIIQVIKHEGITSSTSATMEEFTGMTIAEKKQ
jgi:undecaprenyl phosphate N,N'-diacetylbacillosamine 1-phosphate transferase